MTSCRRCGRPLTMETDITPAGAARSIYNGARVLNALSQPGGHRAAAAKMAKIKRENKAREQAKKKAPLSPRRRDSHYDSYTDN